MFISTGIDLTQIERFARLSEQPRFLERAFVPTELDDSRPAHLAGIFAAKEAVLKAIGKPPNWRAITVSCDRHGRPRVLLDSEIRDPDLQSIDVSISHEGDYAVAIAVAIFAGERASST